MITNKIQIEVSKRLRDNNISPEYVREISRNGLTLAAGESFIEFLYGFKIDDMSEESETEYDSPQLSRRNGNNQ